VNDRYDLLFSFFDIPIANIFGVFGLSSVVQSIAWPDEFRLLVNTTKTYRFRGREKFKQML
jgi:hypothetical protein